MTGSRALIVLGMHRSGTSALAGVLTRLGADAGPDLQEGNEHNLKGYFEHKEIIRIHDDLLAQLGLAWDDVRPLPVGWERGQPAARAREALTVVVQRDFGASDLWLVKDPRMCRLMPLWLELLTDLGARPLCVISIRQPAEVVASLQRRDGIAESKTLLLWLLHMIEAEQSTRECPRIVVSYHQLLEEPLFVATRVSATLGLSLKTDDRTATESIEDFLSSDLRHHKVTDRARGGAGPLLELSRSVFSAFCRSPDSAALATALQQRSWLAEQLARLASDLTASPR